MCMRFLIHYYYLASCVLLFIKLSTHNYDRTGKCYYEQDFQKAIIKSCGMEVEIINR